MKNLTLIMAVLTAFLTTLGIILFYVTTEPSDNNLASICLFSGACYLGSATLFKEYMNICIKKAKDEAYMAGYDAGSTDQYI